MISYCYLIMKKRKQYFKNMILYKRGSTFVTSRILLKTLFYNCQVVPAKRFIYKSDSYYNSSVCFMSRLKLRCSATGGKRVPSRQYFLSRFFLTKYIDNLSLGGVIKK